MQTAFLIYTFLYLFALLFILPFEYFKRPSQLRKKWIKEKFGFFSKRESKLPTVWVHAVSVGEVVSVSRMVKELSKKYRIVLTTITDTGQKVAKERFKDFNVDIFYMPFDIPFAINKFLRNFSPVAIIITETELWPNLIRIGSQNTSVILVNGRISDRSYKGYCKVKFFIKSLLRKMSLICVQEYQYREKLINLGAEDEKIYVTGNMKFDIEIKEIKFSWEKYIPNPVILAGSTHEPEEEIILDSFLKLSIDGTLMLAPRHPERFIEVENLIRKKISNSDKKILFSKLSSFHSVPSNQNQTLILLIDQMGILGSLYRVCDLAIVGGSFIPHGGQNPLEPAYWKKPIICGPYMDNFPFIEEFIREKACLIVDKDSLVSAMKDLIENPKLSETIGNRAYQLFLNKAGATKRTIKLIEKLIP
ncbi:MAG: 3-deoxy-D-manno-octulosonic acid transferase [Thermodesulfovibrio sp.]|nr:3-deoxy-D-manno-octulosonic acid transferase [Thermodesulfovibrio sp.]